MKRFQHLQTAGRRSLRFKGSIASLLQDIAGGTPLYVHARNRVAELAAIVPLTGLVADEAEKIALFPEEGLLISLAEVKEVHGVTIHYRDKEALALEFATPGEPRSISIAAIPGMSDMERFTRCLHRHPAEILSEAEYQGWREEFTVWPVICPCCMAAMEERRASPERNPLTRILEHAIELELELRCEIISPAIGFCTWITPGAIQFANGLPGIIGRDAKKLLEIDYGRCHSLGIRRRKIDGEVFSEVCLHDSLGQPQLRIGTRGGECEVLWRGLCGES